MRISNEILMHFRAIRKNAAEVSISDPLDSEGDGSPLTLMDVFSGEDCMIEQIDLKMQADRLYQAVEQVCDQREKEIVSLRYGLYGKRPLTQREISKKLGISRSYVSRIDKKALLKLKKKLS